MAKVRFHPLLEYIRGTIKGMVFRRTQKGKTSVYMSPDMSRVKWSSAQDAHRERMAEAYAYASQATKDPEIKAYYLKMAWEQEHNRRPYNKAVSDYYQNRNNLLGNRFYWNAELWRAKYEERKRKRKKHW